MYNIKNLLAEERIKRKNNVSCSHCKRDISVGNKYISVHYKDTYIKKGFGAFHIKCWTEFTIKN